MSEQRKKVYKAHIHYACDRRKGVSVFCHYGYLSPCGEWVEGNDMMWRRTPDWCDTEAEALAKLAPEIAEIGARLIQQAAELLEATKPAEVAT